MPFRKALIWIKKQYTGNSFRLFLFSGVGVILFAGISLLLDFLLPWNQTAVFVRAIISLPLAACIFVFAYGGVIAYVDRRVRDSEESSYKTWRERLSPTMRTRISIIIGAVLFVIMFAVTMRPGYTIAASCIVAIVAGLFVFMRKTSLELRRETIGLPDARDAAFDSHVKKVAQTARQSRRSKKVQEELEREKEKTLKLEENLEK